MHVQYRNSQQATIDQILLKYVAFKRNIHILITVTYVQILIRHIRYFAKGEGIKNFELLRSQLLNSVKTNTASRFCKQQLRLCLKCSTMCITLQIVRNTYFVYAIYDQFTFTKMVFSSLLLIISITLFSLRATNFFFKIC